VYHRTVTRPIPAVPWLAALVLAVAPAPAVGQVLRYGGDPGTARTYVREQHDRVLQTIDGRQLGTEIRSYWRLDTTVTDASAEVLTLAIEHDSLALSGLPAGADVDLGELREISVEIEMSRRGEVREVTIPDPLPSIVARLDLATNYRNLFPRLPEGEVAEGATWSDTTRVSASQNGVELRVQRVNQYASKGWASHGARRVLRVDYEGTLTIEGSGEQQEAGIVLSGSGRAAGSFAFDPEAGALAAGGETTEMRMVALVSAEGQNLIIPIVQSRSETITLVEPEASAGE
jgi:hypothetical protein